MASFQWVYVLFYLLSAPCGVRVRHPLVFSVCFLPCGVRVRPTLVFSGTLKLRPLVFSVFFLLFFLLPAADTTPGKRETKKSLP